MVILPDNENRHLGDLAPRVFRWGVIVGLGAIGLSVLIGLSGEASLDRFFRSYLLGFIFVLSLCLGALFFVILQHLTKAGWSVVIRRIAEGLAGNLTWLWIGFIPVVVGLYMGDLYKWVDPPEGDELLKHKEAYLDTTFWLVRAVFYFAVWGLLARYFVRCSMDQDEHGDPKNTLRMQRVAAPGMVLYAFTQTFAIIDWVMTLEPYWYSTMFGVYFFSASACGFAAMLIILCALLQRTVRVTQSITTEHYHDLGKYLFAFGIFFWAYIAYCQYMLIWYANIPEETIWFVIRQLGGWKSMSILLLLGHFAGPFLLLLSRYPKRFKGVLTAACVWMLFIHFVDIYWLVMPRIPAELIDRVTSYPQLEQEFATGVIPGTALTYQEVYDLNWHLLDLTCVVGLLSLIGAMTARRLRDHCLIPEKDPRLGESLAFDNY